MPVGGKRPVLAHHRFTRDVPAQVRRVVGTLVAGRRGAVDIEVVAEALGTSVRTLQRRLRAAGTTYAAVVQQARCAVAQDLLRNPRRTIGEIACAVGYSDHAHFTRAFQRWTGSTPRDYRRRSAPSKAPPHRVRRG